MAGLMDGMMVGIMYRMMDAMVGMMDGMMVGKMHRMMDGMMDGMMSQTQRCREQKIYICPFWFIFLLEVILVVNFS